jgi:hypothetical protein
MTSVGRVRVRSLIKGKVGLGLTICRRCVPELFPHRIVRFEVLATLQLRSSEAPKYREAKLALARNALCELASTFGKNQLRLFDCCQIVFTI